MQCALTAGAPVKLDKQMETPGYRDRGIKKTYMSYRTERDYQ